MGGAYTCAPAFVCMLGFAAAWPLLCCSHGAVCVHHGMTDTSSASFCDADTAQKLSGVHRHVKKQYEQSLVRLTSDVFHQNSPTDSCLTGTQSRQQSLPMCSTLQDILNCNHQTVTQNASNQNNGLTHSCTVCNNARHCRKQLPLVPLQLLYPEDQNQKVRQMIQQYGQGLTGTDACLALQYYWQAAAVVNASQSVQVLLHLILLVSCVDVYHKNIVTLPLYGRPIHSHPFPLPFP